MNNQSNLAIKNVYNTNDINNIFNQAIKIYNMYNDFDGNKEKEKKDFIINLSHDFLSSSYSSIESQNNYYIEHSSFSENSFSFKSWKIKGINIKENESKKIKYKKDEIIVTDLRYMFYGCSSLYLLQVYLK